MLSIKTSTSFSRQWLSDLFSIALLLCSFYAIWIGSHALFTPDEGRYSEVAREMIVTGDYITPRLNGVVFLDKPILYYWLQASAIKLFGLKEWALRLWPALLGIIGCLATYLAGRILFTRRTAIISTFILASCPLYYGAAHYANLDLEVAVLVSCSLLAFITAMRVSQDKMRSLCLITAYVFAGFAALTKGLIGLAFPMMIIGAWILLLNRWGTLKKMHLISGLIIFTAIVAPWYILVQKANPEFFQFFFVKQQVSRFLTTDHFNNRTHSWFYLPIVFAGLFPWCIFVIQALGFQIKKIWRNRQHHSVELFLMLWLVLVFLFFSIPKSKTIGYILPIFPALALIIGDYLSHLWDKPASKGLYAGIIGMLILCIGISVTCFVLPFTPHVSTALAPYLVVNGVIFAISAGVLALFFKRKLSQIFYLILFTASAFLLMLSASSSVLNEKTIKPLALQIKSQLQPTDEVVTFYKYFQDLPIYLNMDRRITIVTDWQATDIPLNDNWVRELWYGMPFQDTKEWLINEEAFWQRWESNKRLFVFTDVDSFNDLQKKSKKPVYKIAQHNQNILISNEPLAENPELAQGKS